MDLDELTIGRWLCVAAMVCAGTAPLSFVKAQPARERHLPIPIVDAPWRDHRRPQASPGAPTASPATRGARRVLAQLLRLQTEVRTTRYRHRLRVRVGRGLYEWDCSGMAAWVLRRSAGFAARQLPSDRRALAVDFARIMERAPLGRFRRGWQRLASIEDVRPGDLVAWRRPPGFPSRNTGHVAFVLTRPRPIVELRGGFAIDIVDATRGGHEADSRPWPGEGGYGTGIISVLVDDAGRGTHYGWAGIHTRTYVETPVLFGRVQR